MKDDLVAVVVENRLASGSRVGGGGRGWGTGQRDLEAFFGYA